MTAPSVGPPEPGEVSGTMIPAHEFTVVSRGFDQEQVRTYVAHVLAEVARLARDNWELRRRLETAEREAPDTTLADLRAELQRAMARLEQIEAERRLR
ncbi:MAG: hypothetical protein HKN44_01945 [Ilumatobacter sp.]|nr:hypothetical protein [Ilumatobacter sp.]